MISKRRLEAQFEAKPRSLLGPSILDGNDIGPVGLGNSSGAGSSRLFSFNYHTFRSHGSILGSLQRPPNQKYTHSGQQDGKSTGNPYYESPKGHGLLGVKIGGGLLAFFLGWLGGLKGFYGAGNSLDRVLNAQKQAWVNVIGWLTFAILSAAVAVLPNLWLLWLWLR